ncbi:hypothetical protein ACE15N_21260 [Xanthomonas campestris pv. passiflorae]|uniref:hypothetical protein n=1 Tax=Xanthomonas campestris TaxID=339 RepID=UPI002424E43D|nr:hypothetical protein [Xanthomonas campestris]MBV6814687.1 hypothetical protein [Xanthomonas campestris pv. passiflorae]
MTPTSEELEVFLGRLSRAYAELGANHNFARLEQTNSLADIARDWLRLSAALKETADGFLPAAEKFDGTMAEMLKATKQRTRTSTFRMLLEPLKSDFMDEIVVPLMRHEGSPVQAAARQLEALFSSVVSSEEAHYISEAARCSVVRCHRAAIVMLWAAAIARFHAAIQNFGFMSYNAAAAAANKKKGSPFNRVTSAINITSIADLQLGRDFDLLVVGMELWGYDSQTFDELNRCLSIRNSAAHPGSFEPSSLDVRQFAEKLKKNVFEKIVATSKA